MNKNKSTRKNNKGAALIIVLFTLVIVSVFMSLMYSVSRKQILSETKERQASLYSQYLRTTLDLLVSPLIMGDSNNTDRNNGDFSLVNQGWIVRSGGNNIIFAGNPSGDIINGYSFDIYYRINNTNNLWALSYVNIKRRRIRGDLTIIPTYDITINTVVAQLSNNPNGNFNNVIGRLSNSQIRYSGRALATVVQRTPYNISTNTAMFVKHQMIWNPFGADPFVALNSANNIDKSLGLTYGYDIKGDLSAPNLNANDVNNAFRVNSGRSALSTSGFTSVWYGTNSNSRLISGGSSTGYVNIYVNSNNLTSASDFSIKTYNTKKYDPNRNSTGANEGKLPGTNDNGNIDLSKINNNQMVRININSNNAVLVGSNANGEVTRRPQNGGGLIEMIWPTDNNNGFMPNNDTTRAIVNSYPPKYATVYLVPNGNELTIFAVGGYSKQKVNVNTLLNNIQNLPSNGRTVDHNNNEIRINLNRLTPDERERLTSINVNGGNVVVMPNGPNNNGLYYFENNNTNNPPKPFDLTVISTRFNNTDSLTNRNFYRDNGAAGDLGGWNIPNNFNPNNGQINLGGNGGATYILPTTSDSKWDNRRQVVRALEGNVIINNFTDNNYDFKNTNERVGFVGYNNNSGAYERFIRVRNNNNEVTVPLKPINIVSQNFVVLNYQDKNYNSNNFYLSANIITTRGSLTIPDRDIYRWLMDGGRFNVNEYNDPNNGFINYIIRDKTLKWYGKYIANFSSVEGVVNPNNQNQILGFSNVELTASDTEDLGKGMPIVNRQDWYISIGSKKIILYDIVRFELNK
jgi:hypothetical protein